MRTYSRTLLIETHKLQTYIARKRVHILCVEPSPKITQTWIPQSQVISPSVFQDNIRRNLIHKEQFANLMSRLGIEPHTPLVLYDIAHGVWAAYAAWVFHLFGHTNLQLLNGGYQKWMKEKRPTTPPIPSRKSTIYPTPERNDHRYRALLTDTTAHIQQKKLLLDVRSSEEYRGLLLNDKHKSQTGAVRSGHIPSAINIPWTRALQADGTFLPRDELKMLYSYQHHIPQNADLIVYSRSGERAAHTWFVLTCILNMRKVRCYDGSWLEWGNLINAPIALPNIKR